MSVERYLTEYIPFRNNQELNTVMLIKRKFSECLAPAQI